MTARNSSIVIWCEFEQDECDDEQLDCVGAENIPGPSSDTDSLAHDSSNECSGIIPRDTALLPTTEPPFVNSSGVEWDSSWSGKKVFKIIKINLYYTNNSSFKNMQYEFN